MDKMVSMKMSKKEKKEAAGDAPVTANASNGPDYPWGLEINLEDESLEKMGVNMSEHSIGDTVTLHAQCKITSMSQSEREGGNKNKSMRLQITDMCLDGMMDESEDDEDEDLDWDEDKRSADRKLDKKGY